MSRDDDAFGAMLATPSTAPARPVGARDTALPPPACLSNDVVALHVAGNLADDERERVRAHLDDCASCRAVVMHAAKAIEPREGPNDPAEAITAAASPTALFPAVAARLPDVAKRVREVIGRFAILDQLGAGGMGVVYAAYDEQLDRKVALKLVRTDLVAARPAATRKAMLREAQAMAKVEHPNVITVYEVGEHEDQIFVAMELVKGCDLRAWMTAKQRGWREALDVCLQAGRGLAAAHRANLVHRDFKPDNVLVGDDGRVRVTDFGLARALADAPDEPHAAGEPPRRASDRLTRTGALVGTPAYMAPEQHRLEPAGERSDQFAFCVTAWEALYGDRPFAGTTYAELASNVLENNVRKPDSAAVPIAVEAVLRRGLQPDEADRFASMAELLAALSPRRRSRWLVLAGALVLVVAAVAITYAVTRRDDTAAVVADTACPSATAKLAGVWDADRRTAVTQTLTAAAPFGARVAERVVRELDGYAAGWSIAWSETCALRGEQSDTLFDRRVGCMTRRLKSLDTVAATFAHASTDARPALAMKASQLLQTLDPYDVCSDPVLMSRAIPASHEARLEIIALDEAIDRASTLRIAGDYAGAGKLIDETLARAERLAFRPSIATALLARGELEIDRAEYAAAEKSLQRASSEAFATNEDTIAASAMISLVDVVGYHLGRPQEAHRFADLANAALERSGNTPTLRIALATATSKVLLLEGKHAEAIAALDRAIALARKLDDFQLVEALSAKGVALFETERYAEARTLMAEELALRERAAGKDHPLYGDALENRANLEMVANELDAAIADLRESRRIKVAAFGAGAIELATVENNLGVIAGLLGDWDEALRAARVAAALVERSNGKKHPDTARARANIASALRELGKLADAEAEMVAVLAIRRDVLGDAHADVGISYAEIGELRLAQGKPRDAIAEFAKSLAILTAALGAEHTQLAYTCAGLGRAQLAAGDARTARATLAATVVQLEGSQIDPKLLASTRLALADATWRTGARADAIAIAAKAAPALDKLPASSNAKLRRQIADWQLIHH